MATFLQYRDSSVNVESIRGFNVRRETEIKKSNAPGRSGSTTVQKTGDSAFLLEMLVPGQPKPIVLRRGVTKGEAASLHHTVLRMIDAGGTFSIDDALDTVPSH